MLHDRRNGDGQMGCDGRVHRPLRRASNSPRMVSSVHNWRLICGKQLPIATGQAYSAFRATPLKLEHHGLLATLYSGGVRRLLLDGDPDLTEPSLADDLVDHMVAYLADSGLSSHLLPTGQDPWPRTASTSPASPAFHAMCRSTRPGRFADHARLYAERTSTKSKLRAEPMLIATAPRHTTTCPAVRSGRPPS